MDVKLVEEACWPWAYSWTGQSPQTEPVYSSTSKNVLLIRTDLQKKMNVVFLKDAGSTDNMLNHATPKPSNAQSLAEVAKNHTQTENSSLTENLVKRCMNLLQKCHSSSHYAELIIAAV